MLTRIARSSTQTIRAAFDGGASGTVSVTVKDADGSEVVAATDVALDGDVASYDLTPDDTANLGRLTATWTDGGGQIVTSQHDVVGFHLISLNRLRTFDPLQSTTTYSDELLELGRDTATYALERACNRAFAPTLAREIVRGRGTRYLQLRAAGGVSELVGISQGTEQLVLDGITAAAGGIVERASGRWHNGGAFTVSYVYGEEAVDPRVSRAIGLITADLLFEDNPDAYGSAISERATSMSTDDGTFSLVTAGLGGNAFSLPEVNAVVQQWRLPN